MYFQCWLKVTKQERSRDKWLTDETYYRAIKAQFPTLESLDFDRGMMNKAISTQGGILGAFHESIIGTELRLGYTYHNLCSSLCAADMSADRAKKAEPTE
jgi:hypothetical protein